MTNEMRRDIVPLSNTVDIKNCLMALSIVTFLIKFIEFSNKGITKTEGNNQKSDVISYFQDYLALDNV